MTLTTDAIRSRFAGNERLAAIGLMCAATFSFSLLDSSAKYVTAYANIPVFEAVWLRFLSHLILNAIFLRPHIWREAFATKRPATQMFRSAFLCGSTIFNFLALQYLQLDQTTTVFFLAPFIVALLAGPFLDEWIGWRRFTAICVGFCGILVVFNPAAGKMHWAYALALTSTLSYALYSLLTRHLSRHDTSETTQVFSPFAGVLIFAPLALMNWKTPDTVFVAVLLFFMGVWGGFGHWLVILAHKRAPAPIIAPFAYINIVFMTFWGYAVFGDVPAWTTLLGAAIIIASGIYLVMRERQKRSPLAPASSATIVEG
jgi:drug/metabolite transporter (DMT)-like permease